MIESFGETSCSQFLKYRLIPTVKKAELILEWNRAERIGTVQGIRREKS